ncbi:MAG: C25 family cysteine peptidase [Saprospiraceae bacterium]
MRKLLKTLLLLLFSFHVSAQMAVGTDTLFGNEWINFDQSYFKIKVAADGLYRLDKSQLEAAGIPVTSIAANQLRLYRFGKEVPLYLSTAGSLNDNDFLLFWGEKNRGEMDRYLFAYPEENQLNPYYSLVTDTSSYFLTWNSTPSTTRYQTLESDLSQVPAKEAWVWGRQREVFSEKFMKNYTRRSGITVYFSHYDVAEGYGNRDINELLAAGSTVQNFAIDLPKAYTGGPAAIFSARFGVGEGEHHQLVKVDGSTYFDRNYFDIAVKAPNFSFPVSGDKAAVVFEGVIDNRDEQSIAFIDITYPMETHAGNQAVFAFEMDGSATDKYLEIQGFNQGNGLPVLYDLTNKLRVIGRYENGLVKALLPASEGRRSLVFLEENRSAQSVLDLQAHPFVDLMAQAANFLILTSPELRKPYEDQDQVQAYADYRQSPQGGSYVTKIVEVQDLYDQFGYGIHRHPQSIRNFVHLAKRRWSNLQYVFLVGKGREYVTLRSADGLAEAKESFFVPSFGYPASDNLMLSTNTSSVAIVPVGRIAATEPREVSIYLHKVKTLEATTNNGQSIEERAWMKNIIHLGGGGNSDEQAAIKNNLERMAREIEGNLFGAKVTPFYKTSTDPIQQSRSEQIFNRINEGTSVITFFGHSSPGTFDFNIDNPDNYDNFGKFPLILSLGCYSGNFYTGSKGIGERFTFYEDKAAVAFGASRGVGFINTLGAFANRFYENMGGANYGKSIGEVVRATRQSLDHLSSLEVKTIVQQFTVLGDPSIRLHGRPGPDYVVDRSSVSFSPKVVSIQEDSFQIQFDVLNLGQYIQDSINILIRQKLPSGTEQNIRSLRIATPAYSSSHTVSIPTLGKAAIGLNTFFLEVDANNEVAELPAPAGEMNNSLVRSDGQAGVTLFIVDNTARPVYPQKFALVGQSPVTLKASTSDALAPERKYLMEIDTTHLFNSPSRQRTEIVQRGGVIKWTPTLPMKDSTVYYWRISPDSTEAEIGYVWEASSFTYVEGIGNGWGQGHWGQWLEGEEDGLGYKNEFQSFDFNYDPLEMQIINKVYDSEDRAGFMYNNGGFASSVRPWGYLNEGVAVMVGIPRDGHFWLNTGRNYGSVDGGGNAVFSFKTVTTSDRKLLIDFLEEVIPNGYYVYLFSVQANESSSYYSEDWQQDITQLGTDLFQVLEDEGAELVRNLNDLGSVPYAFMYQKRVGPLDEDIASDVFGRIKVESIFPEYREYGVYRSSLIGPANSWGRLNFDMESSTAEDSTILQIFGISNEDSLLLLQTRVTNDIPLDFIDAKEFPYLKLEMEAKTKENRLPRQLKSWYILYDGVPELVVAPNVEYTFIADSVQQGQEVNLKVAIENISGINADSLLFSYTLTNAVNNNEIYTKRLNPINRGDSINIFIRVPTTQRSGLHNLLLEINPQNDQPELFHFNNFLEQSFTVISDKKSPVLDVTFDGSHIMNGDLVSINPIIVVNLKDENQYLELKDTSLFSMQLTYPNGDSRSISFADDNILFYPADLSKGNTASIEYYPHFIEGGTYKLMIQATDVSGNLSGHFNYEVDFQVITERSIANVLNYPNPFSTATHFVYTITGEPPAYFSIQIMTVAGRVVKEIRQEELGEMRVGTHQTEYAWDGTDEYGDQLANGVYFYRIIAKDEEGQDYKAYQNGTDKFFKKGIGKMVLLR